MSQESRFQEALDLRLAPEGDAPESILFVCARNSCRSQMAEAFLRAWSLGTLSVQSAGLTPLGRVDPLARKVMQEQGISLDGHASKPLSPEMESSADIIIHLRAPGEPPFPRQRNEILEWEVEDPLGWPLDIYLDVREEIFWRVQNLLERIVHLRSSQRRTRHEWSRLGPRPSPVLMNP